MRTKYCQILVVVSLLLIAGVGTSYVAEAETSLTEFQPYAFTAKLFASDGMTSDQFAAAMALSSDEQVLVVGAPLDDVIGKSNQGQIYIYRRDDDNWTEVQKIAAADGAAEDMFGAAIDIADDYTIIVGATDADIDGADNIGAAYIFAYNGTSWSQEAKLDIFDENEFSHDNRGQSVAISSDGTVAFVGAPRVTISGRTRGTLYILSRSGSTWSQTQKIIGPTDGRALIGKTMFLSHDDDSLFVSGNYSPTGASLTRGIVHLYERTGDNWLHSAELIPSDSQEFDEFGQAITTSGDDQTLLIGAFGEEQSFIFTKSSGSWEEQAVLQSPASSLHGHFGASVALNDVGTQAVVGAWLNGSGGIHVFRGGAENWQFAQTLRTSNRAQEHLGFSLAMTGNGDMIFGGARSAHPDLETFDPLGAVYVYVPGHFSHLPIVVR